MQTVVETPAYLSDAAEAGVGEVERSLIVDLLSANPSAGDLIPGAGGCRKVRFAGRGKGKSGGFRVITFFADDVTPVFLIAIFGKGDKANLTKAECNQLAVLTKRLLDAYRRRVVAVSFGRR